MRTLRLRFYPLMRDEDENIVINFDEYLSRDIYFSSKTSNDDIIKRIEALEHMQVIWISSWDIYDGEND